MSSTDGPKPGVVERVRAASREAGASARAGGGHPSRRRRLAVRFAAFLRWLHIYLSMLSLALILFFSATGVTLNHPDWFFGGAETSREAEGQLKPEWLHLNRPAPEAAGDLSHEVDKLEVVEHLRKADGVRGALTNFRVDEGECVVTFKGPGYSADAFVDRRTGRYRLGESSHGLVAVLNDLHKGRDTGPGWSVVIDVSAVFMTVVSLTGLVLLFYLKLRRKPGVAVALAGTAAAAAAYFLLVP